MPADKTLESVHFKSFRWLAKNDVPDGSVTHSGAFEQPAPDGAPDFIIHSADRAIGVEHREVLKLTPTDQLPERAHEGNEDEVIAMTKELTELRGTRLAHVSFSFGRGLPSKRPDRLALARVLSSLVHEHAPADDRHVVLDHTHFVRRGIYSVDRISLYRNDQVRPGHWFALRGGPVTSDCVELLQAAIDDKAKKYASYRTQCAECWLLLVADSAKPSSLLHADERSLAHVYRSPFDRTYFLDFGMGKLYRLPTEPPRS